MNKPSLVENRASSPSSMETSGAAGLGSAIRARPIRLISSPLPNETAMTAIPSTREKQVKLTPAANQNVPRSGPK